MVKFNIRGISLKLKVVLEISAIILAGGKGLRLGKDKVLETIGERSLLEQVITCVSPLSREIIIVTAGGKSIPQYHSTLKSKVVTDIYPGKGPLGGIYTGLTIANTFYNLVLATDMPFLNRELLRYMIQMANNYDITVPRMGKLVEPLHAVYAKSCLSQIESMLERDKLDSHELLKMAKKVRYIESAEIERFDPEHLSFFNINTKEDLLRARKLAVKYDDD
ncbi:molybdenum cofactor guanylyltransferase [Chloroflexota bacterium]